MQDKNNKHLMRSITADEKYWVYTTREEIKPKAFDLAASIFVYLVQTGQYPEGLNFKISNNPNRDFDFCQDVHFTKPITQLETILYIVTNIIDNLPANYNEVTRILVTLYYL